MVKHQHAGGCVEATTPKRPVARWRKAEDHEMKTVLVSGRLPLPHCLLVGRGLPTTLLPHLLLSCIILFRLRFRRLLLCLRRRLGGIHMGPPPHRMRVPSHGHWQNILFTALHRIPPPPTHLSLLLSPHPHSSLPPPSRWRQRRRRAPWDGAPKTVKRRKTGTQNRRSTTTIPALETTGLLRRRGLDFPGPSRLLLEIRKRTIPYEDDAPPIAAAVGIQGRSPVTAAAAIAIALFFPPFPLRRRIHAVRPPHPTPRPAAAAAEALRVRIEWPILSRFATHHRFPFNMSPRSRTYAAVPK